MILTAASACAGASGVPEPYVRLDGEEYSEFADAFEDAAAGSTIEVCGTWVGPFSRDDSVEELSIEGCGAEWAVLDGDHQGSVLALPVGQLAIAGVSIIRGRTSEESFTCGDDFESDCLRVRPATVGGVAGRLELAGVRIADSIGSAESSGLGIALTTAVSAVDPGITIAGEDSVVEDQFHDGAEALACTFEFALQGELILTDFDWGTDGAGHPRYDVCGVDGSGDAALRNLEGIADVECTPESGCRFGDL